MVSAAVITLEATNGLILDVGDTSVWHGALNHQIVYRCEQVSAHAPIVLVVAVDHFLWG